MSLEEARMPSLREKLEGQAVETPPVEEPKKKVVKIIKRKKAK